MQVIEHTHHCQYCLCIDQMQEYQNDSVKNSTISYFTDLSIYRKGMVFYLFDEVEDEQIHNI